jgi:HEAT repeat protein
MATGQILGCNAGTILSHLGEDAIRALEKALYSPNTRLRQEAVVALGGFSEESKGAVRALMKALHDIDRTVRLAAIDSLGSIGPGALESVPVLIDALDGKCLETQAHAGAALARIGTKSEVAISRIISLAETIGHPGRSRGIWSLAKLGVEPARLFRIAVRGLEDQDPLVCRVSAGVVGEIGREDPTTVHLLLRALDHPDWEVRKEIVESLGKCGRGRGEVEEALLKVAETDPEYQVSVSALRACSGMGIKAETLVEAMLRFIAKTGCTESACDIIAELGPAGAGFLPHLQECLREGDADLKWAAASAMAALGPNATAAIPELLKSLGDQSGLIAGNAALALSQMGEPAVAPLTRSLSDDNPRTREFAADALGRMGTAAKSTVPNLVKRLGVEPVEEVRCWVAIALAEIDRRPDTLPILIEALATFDRSMKLRAIQALGSFGTKARAATDVLQAMHDSKDQAIADAAKDALIHIQA